VVLSCSISFDAVKQTGDNKQPDTHDSRMGCLGERP
jgi:hypothetical protein